MERKKITLFGAVAALCLLSCGLAFCEVAFCGVAWAQDENTSSQNVNESACVAQPISLTNVAGLNFGRIISGAQAGTITVSATGSISSNNVTNGPAPYSGSSAFVDPSAATFYVTGEPGFNYSITTPATSTVSNGNNHMTITFGTVTAETVGGYAPSGSLNGAGTASAIASNGYDAWAIGATLSVGANQPSGTYTGTFQETVQYQ